MLLTIDVGNTHTVLGLFDGEEIVEHWRISTDARRTADELAVLLQGLDIGDELHERRMGELQGGQKVRVLLAQALFGNPEALLLDEPTNYLDLDSIHWLEDFLNRFSRQAGYGAGDIQGRVIEIGGDDYARRFASGDGTTIDVLHVSAENPKATVVGDLVTSTPTT